MNELDPGIRGNGRKLVGLVCDPEILIMAGGQIFFALASLRIHIIITEKNQVIPVRGGLLIEKTAGIRLYVIITVYEPDIFPVGVCEAIVSRPAYSVILCRKDKKLLWM